jgi:hypothetical protein
VDIAFRDKNRYAEKESYIKTDYIELIHDLVGFSKELGRYAGLSDEFVQKVLSSRILDKQAKSKLSTGEPAKYKDLLEGWFEIRRIIRIDSKEDIDDIAGKYYDFSHHTIEDMMNAGYLRTSTQETSDIIEGKIGRNANRQEIYYPI